MWAEASNLRTSSNGALYPPSQRRRARDRSALQNPVGARGLLETFGVTDCTAPPIGYLRGMHVATGTVVDEPSVRLPAALEKELLEALDEADREPRPGVNKHPAEVHRARLRFAPARKASWRRDTLRRPARPACPTSSSSASAVPASRRCRTDSTPSRTSVDFAPQPPCQRLQAPVLFFA